MKKNQLQSVNSAIRNSNRQAPAPAESIGELRAQWEADQSKLAVKIVGLRDKVSAAIAQACTIAKMLNMAPRFGKSFKIATPKMLKDLGAIQSQLIACKLQLEQISK